MKLYYSKGACSLAPRIIINEVGLTCEYESVDLINKQTQSGINFRTINPKGVVPVLITNNNEVLTENAVILQYLVESVHADKLLPQTGNFARYRVLEWLNFITTELHKSFSPLFNPAMPQEIKENLLIPFIKAKFGYVNTRLDNSAYLLGDDFTLPDAYLFVMTTWALYFKMNLADWPNLSRYFSTLCSRKSIQQSLEQEGIQLK